MKKVKVALDACVPPRAVGMLQSGFGDLGFDFIWEPHFAASSAEDETWAVAFRRFGGEVVITGDKAIARRPHQIMAFKESGLICFFCQRAWAQQDLTFQAVHLCMWWPRIQQQLVSARPGDCWWVPMGLRETQSKRWRFPQMSKSADQSKQQHERFVETARQLECDEDKERFEAKMKRIAKVAPTSRGDAERASRRKTK